MAEFIAGFDPGGSKKFGWCLCENSSELPLVIRATGIVSAADSAKCETLRAVQKNDGKLVALGIDAPLFWNPSGGRKTDACLRKLVRAKGGETATIMAVNSLPGACVVQGTMLAMLFRNENSAIPITEAHPKAMLMMWNHDAKEITLEDLSKGQSPWFDISGLSLKKARNDHIRDAALAALAAWAMLQRKQEGWCDLYHLFKTSDHMTPLGDPLHFYFPVKEAKNIDFCRVKLLGKDGKY